MASAAQSLSDSWLNRCGSSLWISTQSTLAESIASWGDAVVPVVADIAVRTQVAAAVQTAVSHFGRLDVLAANAGIADGQPFLDIDDLSWERIIDVNINGTFHCIQEAARAMAPNRRGAIVCTSSTNAWYVEKNLAHYNTSKGGVEAMVRSAAIDLGEYGIRVNAVEPSMVKTRAAFITEDPIGGPEYLKRVPMGRFADPAEIAAAVAWLAIQSGVVHHRSIADSRRWPDAWNRYAAPGSATARFCPG